MVRDRDRDRVRVRIKVRVRVRIKVRVRVPNLRVAVGLGVLCGGREGHRLLLRWRSGEGGGAGGGEWCKGAWVQG